jgi:hypothetical protein
MTAIDRALLYGDDDDLNDDASGGPDSPRWFQRPALEPRITFAIGAVLLILTWMQYRRRVAVLRQKFGTTWSGTLRVCSMISAYMDNDEATFAVARLVTKSFFFLGMLQIDFHRGFLIMLGILVIESCVDMARILLAYWNCKSLEELRNTSEDEAREISTASTELEPTNVYEDLTRPRTIAVMVFLIQTLLIGIVMYDSYSTTTRTCFNGVATDVCPMLSSLGSYCLYFMGTFMACVFYVGPMNSYGKKEHDPVFWLKLFLMSKQGSVLSWQDPRNPSNIMCARLRCNDWRIWLRFVMSVIVNSVCFHFLLHVLPVQIASKSSIMGVVFSSVGMIYLVDLDDTSGTVMTLVQGGGDNTDSTDTVPLHPTAVDREGYGAAAATATDTNFEAERRRILDEAMKDVQMKLEALVLGTAEPGKIKPVRMKSITQALFLSAQNSGENTPENDNKSNQHDEEMPLLG